MKEGRSKEVKGGSEEVKGGQSRGQKLGLRVGSSCRFGKLYKKTELTCSKRSKITKNGNKVPAKPESECT